MDIRIDSLLVSVIATMLGCKPSHGLVNNLRALEAEEKIEDGDTYGWILKQLCEREIARIGEVSRKPPSEESARFVGHDDEGLAVYRGACLP